MAAGDEAALLLLTELEQDPSRRAIFAAAYDGRHDPLDALAWRAGRRASSGESDPAAALAEANRAAFARPEPDAVAAQAQAELGRLQQQLARDGIALDLAILAVVPDVAAPPDPDAVAPDFPVVDAATAVIPPGLRSRLLLATLGCAIAAVVAASIPVPSLSVFERPASATDDPHAPLATSQFLANFDQVRRIGSAGSLGVFALTYQYRVCLWLVDDHGSSLACTRVDDFEDNGLSVTSSSTSMLGGAQPHRVQVSWGPTGPPRVESIPTILTASP